MMLASLLFLVMIEPKPVLLEDLDISSVVSSASMNDQVYCWVFSNGKPPKAYLVIYDFENQSCREFYDPRINMTLLTSVIPGREGFSLVDNYSQKVACYDASLQLQNTSNLTRWTGYQDLDMPTGVRVSPYQENIGLLTGFHPEKDSMVYALVDMDRRFIHVQGRYSLKADETAFLLHAAGFTYLAETKYGNISVFNLNQGEKVKQLVSGKHEPVLANYGPFSKYASKLVSFLHLPDGITFRENQFYDEHGDLIKKKSSPKRAYYRLCGETITQTPHIVVGINQNKKKALIFDEDDLELRVVVPAPRSNPNPKKSSAR